MGNEPETSPRTAWSQPRALWESLSRRWQWALRVLGVVALVFLPLEIWDYYKSWLPVISAVPERIALNADYAFEEPIVVQNHSRYTLRDVHFKCRIRRAVFGDCALQRDSTEYFELPAYLRWLKPFPSEQYVTRCYGDQLVNTNLPANLLDVDFVVRYKRNRWAEPESTSFRMGARLLQSDTLIHWWSRSYAESLPAGGGRTQCSSEPGESPYRRSP